MSVDLLIRASVLTPSSPVPSRGETFRRKVSLVTVANDAYHAASAVTIPTKPPIWVTISVPVASPIPSRKNVAASSRKMTFTGRSS